MEWKNIRRQKTEVIHIEEGVLPSMDFIVETKKNIFEKVI